MSAFGTDACRPLKPLLRCPTMLDATSPGQCSTNPDEAALLARMQAGDDDAFEACVRTYRGHLLLVARRILGNEEDANDALQDALLSAFRGIGQFKEQAQLGIWLHRIVVNAALAGCAAGNTTQKGRLRIYSLTSAKASTRSIRQSPGGRLRNRS